MTIKINGTNTTAQPSITGADTDTGLVYGTDQVQVVTGGTTRATVDSSGNVKIGGTSSIDTPGLSIETTNTTGGLNIISPDNGRGDIFFGDATDKNVGQIRYSHANNSMTFRTAASDRLTVDSSGIIDFTGPGYTAGSNSCFIKQDSSGEGYLYNRGNNDLLFGTNNTERMRILSSGGLTFNGDTAAANALDDYEEGTWTPTVTLGTVSAFNGKYTKIGNIVNLSGELNNFSDRSTSSALRISSLPFNNLNAQAAGSMFGRYMDRTAYTSYVHQNTIWFYSIGSGNFTELQHQHLNNSGATIYFQATYTVS